MIAHEQRSCSRRDDLTVWSDASLYSIALGLEDKRCIGTTLRGTRCTAKVSADLSRFHSDICQSESPQDVVQAMLQLVLHRCCQANHLLKLQARPICWRAVVEDYVEAYTAAALLLVEVTQNLVVPIDSIHADRLDGYVLPEELTLEQLLKRPLTQKGGRAMAPDGVVYGFTSSAWPGVVKIGYSKHSARTRMHDLARCMPKSEIVIEQHFAFPERMEQLIHLELNSERRTVVRCGQCGKGHEEFFEYEPEDVQTLVGEWRWVAETEPLYDVKTKQLTKPWQQRLAKLTSAATAYELKKLLKAEAEERVVVKMEAELEEVMTQIVQKFEIGGEPAASNTSKLTSTEPKVAPQLISEPGRADSKVSVKAEKYEGAEGTPRHEGEASTPKLIRGTDTISGQDETTAGTKAEVGTSEYKILRPDTLVTVASSLHACAQA